MIKIHASYAKKVPAEVEFSSKSFLASLEIEVADEVARDSQRLQSTLNWIWDELKTSVENQIAGDNPGSSQDSVPRKKSYPQAKKNGKNSENSDSKRASNKQVQFLISLARKKGFDFKGLSEFTLERVGKDSVYHLDPQEASNLIEEFKSQ